LIVSASQLRLRVILCPERNRTRSLVQQAAKPSTNDVLRPVATKMPEDNLISKAFVEHALECLLGHYQPKIERCLEKLTDEQIWWRANQESNSIGNLILHLCGNARQWIISGVGGGPDARIRDAEFEQREVISRDELLTLLRSTLSEIETTLRTLDPSTLLERRQIQGQDVDVLEAIFHVTEHFSMHTGQIIMLTKMLTAKDLRFYDFQTGVPVEAWH
jgi:uncharacterized damage-inducible protein DinB